MKRGLNIPQKTGSLFHNVWLGGNLGREREKVVPHFVENQFASQRRKKSFSLTDDSFQKVSAKKEKEDSKWFHYVEMFENTMESVKIPIF